MKKICLQLLFFAIISTSSLFGSKEKPIKKDIALPPNYNEYKDAPTIFVTAGYLLWNIYPEGINIALQHLSNVPKSSVARPTLSAANGYTISLKGLPQRDNWIASACYTYILYSPAYKNNKLFSPDSYTPNFAETVPVYSQLSSRYELIFNRVDINLFRPTSLSKYIEISPIIGLSGAWDLSYLQYNAQTATPEVQNANFKQEWFGIGPSAGIDLSICLIRPLFLCATIDSAIYFCSHTNTNRNFSYENPTLATQTAINNSTFSFLQVEPNIRSYIGIKLAKSYPYCFIAFSLGWKLSHYYSQVSIPKYFSPTGTSGNLSMQGLLTTIEIGF